MRQIDAFDDRKPGELTLATRQLLERHRRDIAEVSRTAPDLRDKVRFKATGDPKQVVPHGASFQPQLYGTPSIRHEDAVNATVNEYRQADRRNLYLAMTNVPKGATVTCWLVPEDDNG